MAARVPGSNTVSNFSEVYSTVYSLQKINETLPVHCLVTAIPSRVWANPQGDLILFEQINKKGQLSLSDLMQRSVSADRVTKIATNYLNKPTKSVKFFPPIIVALIPKQANGDLYNYYTSDINSTLGIDGLQAGNFQNGQNLIEKNLSSSGLYDLRWDKQKFFALVIDGQHRLSSLRTDAQRYNMDLPAVFVTFDNSGSNAGLDVIRLVRELFIDINNTPVRVSEGRLILMDDQHLFRVGTRSLLFQKNIHTDNHYNHDLPEISSQIWSDVLASGYLPMTLIDFDENESKERDSILKGQLDSGPSCITNIYILERFYRDFLLNHDLNYILETYNPEAKTKIDEFIQSIADGSIEVDREDLDYAFRTGHPLEGLSGQIFSNYLYQEYDRVLDENDDEENQDRGAPLSDQILFTFDSNETEEIRQKLEIVAGIPIRTLFLNLAWSKKIIDAIKKASDQIERLTNENEKAQGLNFLELLISRSAKSNIKHKYDQEDICNELRINGQLRRTLIDIGSEYLSTVESKSQFGNNLFRTSVGQRGLGFMFKKENRVRPLIESIEEAANKGCTPADAVKILCEKINLLSETGFFQRDYRSNLKLGDLIDDTVSLWDGIIVKERQDENGNFHYSMITGDSAAKHFAAVTRCKLGLHPNKGTMKTVFTKIGKIAMSKLNHSSIMTFLRDNYLNDITESPTENGFLLADDAPKILEFIKGERKIHETIRTELRNQRPYKPNYEIGKKNVNANAVAIILGCYILGQLLAY